MKYKVEIIDNTVLGTGVAKIDGKAVFVDRAVKGDKAEVEVIKEKKKIAFAKIVELSEASPLREAPDCDVYDACGGCAFRHVKYTFETEIKKKSVSDAFRRAGIKDIEVQKIITSDTEKYRNKAVFHRLDGGYGFFGEESHKGITCSDCRLTPDIFGEICTFVSEKFGSFAKSIMLRGSASGEVMAVFECDALPPSFLDELTEAFQGIKSVFTANGYPLEHKTKFTHAYGSTVLADKIGELSVNISPASFFQVNRKIADGLYSEIVRLLDAPSGALVLDLYSGIGTIGMYVAKNNPDIKVLGAEIITEAVENAKKNAKDSGISNIEFICADVEAESFLKAVPRPYAVIVDPTRAGLGDRLIKRIIELSPEKIIYMSCSADTLAGNCTKFLPCGYKITSCIAGDMFPRCSHVEAVVLLNR